MFRIFYFPEEIQVIYQQIEIYMKAHSLKSNSRACGEKWAKTFHTIAIHTCAVLKKHPVHITKVYVKSRGTDCKNCYISVRFNGIFDFSSGINSYHKELNFQT